jgi:hypothetical protein
MSEYGWMPAALGRIEQDPLVHRIAVGARPALACAARKAGTAIAEQARTRGWATAEAALRAEGVAIHESAEEPGAGPFVHHARYTAPPPRVTLFSRTLDALDRRLDAIGLRNRLNGTTVREIVLAHELFHHLAATTPMPVAVRPEIEILRFGSWRRRRVVRAAEEIAAAGFAAAWCGADEAPALLDAVTLEIFPAIAPSCRESLASSS